METHSTEAHRHKGPVEYEQRIMIVSEVKNHLMLSIKAHLNEIYYDGILVPANTDIINEVKDPLSGILIHADWETLKQQQPLTALKNRASGKSIPIFTIGQMDALKVLRLIVSQRLIKHEFIRPINEHVSMLALKMDSIIKQYNMQKKILLVDDSGAMLRVVKGWLGDKYNVSAVNSGAMAIKFLALNKPDLILLDYEMPVVDGKQVLEMIRTESDFADIPVMFLTRRADIEDITSVKDLKPEGYLLKTFEPAKIIKAVDDFFEAKKGSK